SRCRQPLFHDAELQQALDHREHEESRWQGSIHRTAQESDVVMENFGPGVLDRLGFSWQQIPDGQVSLLSRDMTLCPGDVIACGTSLGVGSIKDSATVEIEIDGIGVLSNRLAANAVMEAISR